MRFLTPTLALSSLLILTTPHATAVDVPLGSLGAVGDPVPGTPLIQVRSVTVAGPAATAGLKVGDFIAGADGTPLSTTATDSGTGYLGAIQDLAILLDHAEGRSGTIRLNVIRSGSGGLEVPVTVGTPGSFSPAWPAGGGKADALYQNACGRIHSWVQSSSSADFGYTSGWFGIILLSHPDWNQSTGTNAFRTSINKLRTRCETYLQGRVLEPAEAYYWNGTDVVANPAYVSPGLENWDICTSAMFLALYRSKTGDTTADAAVQRATECIAHRIQHWQQYDDPATPHVFGGGIGRMGHGGVHGDYSHYNGTGALNIINAHALPALALLKNAGADMQKRPTASINAFTYNPGLAQPTLEEKFRICWDYVKAATTVSGTDDGNVGYVGRQSGWDSAGRTPGCFAGWKLYGMTANADDADKQQRMASYFVRHWNRQQHAHAYTLGGVVLSQWAMPFLDDRSERFFQENTRLYAQLARQPDGSIAYVPGRQNNGGDGYLDTSRVGMIHAAMPMAIRSGNLPGLPAPSANRIHAALRSHPSWWPSLALRRVKLNGSLSHALDFDVTNAAGSALAASDFTASWSHVSGPATATFTQPASADTTVNFPQAGTYRVNLRVTRGSYTLDEPWEMVVSTAATTPATTPPYVVTQPGPQTVDQGAPVTFTIDAQGSEPLVYQWRLNGSPVGDPTTTPQLVIDSVAAGSAGSYDCVITNAAGTVTSQSATLTVNGAGEYKWGGLWRDVFTGISGNPVSNLTSSPNYPKFPDISGVITTGETPENYADSYGQRWSGWITPPETGSYRFYVAADDAAQVWLSTDATRAKRAKIVEVTSYTNYRKWSTAPQSASISLVKGKRYYIEVLHKDGGGGDHCSITWRRPSDTARPADGATPLPGAVLEYQTGGTLDDLAQPPANYPPVAISSSYLVYGNTITPAALSGDDFENSPLTFRVTSEPTKGFLSGTEPNLVYTPNAGASGTDRFTFTVSDGTLTSKEATVTLSLVPESGDSLQVWTGATDALWTSTGNWKSNTTPATTHAVVFNAESTANLATTLGANRSISRIVVEGPPGTVGITGNTLTLTGGIEMRPATRDLTIASATTISAAQEWSVGESRSITLTGALGGGQALTKTGPGSLLIQAVGTHTGGIRVDQGSLELSGGGWYAGSVGGSGMLTVANGATATNVNAHSFGSSDGATRDITLEGGRFRLSAETYVDDVWSTAGTFDNTPGATGELRSRSSGGSVFTFRPADTPSVIASRLAIVGSLTLDVQDGAATHDLVASGLISSGGALTKNGAGRMLVTADNTHSGSVLVNAGELAVSGSLAAASSVTIQPAATLSGTGTLAGAVTLLGTLAPGIDGIATLTLGSLQLGTNSVTAITLNGTTPGSGHDQVLANAAATLAGTLRVGLAPGFTPAVGDSFTVVRSATRSGTFAKVELPALPADRLWRTTYDGSSTTGVVLSVEAAPKPFEAWQAARFGTQATDPAIAGDAADPDRDGIVNLLEYALALDPKAAPATTGTPGHTALPAVARTGSRLTLTYRRSTAATDLAYTIEQSANPGRNPWTTASPTTRILSESGGVQVVEAALDATGERMFLRLKVTRP
jgi:autotransporter-associated beta strand protein